MTNEIAAELAPLLARAHILMFEYDADGFLVSAVGSCLGGCDPEIEVRAGLVSAAVVRRAASGERVVDRARIGTRSITVIHDPVRDDRGQVERVLATAFDVTEMAEIADPVTPWLAIVPEAS